ncbi:MAG: hypothetical protein AAB425_12725, partial [Bdellovibrionota bacterium]
NTAYESDVTLNANGAASGAGLVDISGGSGVKTITDLVAETVSLTLTDSQGTGLAVTHSASVTFNAGGASKFLLSGPDSSTAGTAISITVRATDSGGNTVVTFTSDVTLAANGSATGAGLVDIISGVGSLSINDTTAETVALSLTDSQGTGLAVTHTKSITFNAGSATKFMVYNPASSTVNTAVSVTVKAVDANNNKVTSYTSDVTLAASGSATGAGLVDIVAGEGTKSINDLVAQNVSLSLTDTQGTGLAVTHTSSVTFNPGTAVVFLISSPTSSTAGTAVSVTVKAVDAYVNTVTSYGNDVTLAASGSATGAGLVDIVSGVGSRSINDTVAQTTNLTLTDSQGTGLAVTHTGSITFSAGAASKHNVSGPSSATVFICTVFTNATTDAYGNSSAVGSTTGVTLNSSGNGTFFLDSWCRTSTASVTVNSGQTSATLFYRQNNVTTASMTA